MILATLLPIYACLGAGADPAAEPDRAVGWIEQNEAGRALSILEPRLELPRGARLSFRIPPRVAMAQ